MLAYRHVRPSRCAYAYNSQAADDSGLYSVVSLFNDSPAPYVLALHDWGSPAGISAFPLAFTVAQGVVGSNPVQGRPVVTNRQQMAGQVTAGLVASVAPNFVNALNPFNQGWLHEFPMIVLAPGWSITGTTGAANTVLSIGYWWQVLTPEELDEMYGDEIDIRVS